MKQDDFDAPGRQGFFHAMVVMGSALALGCGGISGRHPPEYDGAGGTGADAGRGGDDGAATPAGGANAGGLTGLGTAGRGGSFLGGAGGASGGSLGGAAAPTAAGHAGAAATCPSEQWVCDASTRITCRGYDYVLAPESSSAADCTCDTTRPARAADCDSGESFVCHAAMLDAAGTALPAPVPFECECVPRQTDCEQACATAFPQGSRCISVAGASDTDPTLCNCALVLLR